MARNRDPARDKAFEFWKEAGGDKAPKGILKEIADKLGKSETLIRKWKNIDEWGSNKNTFINISKSNVTKFNGNVTNEKTEEKKELIPDENDKYEWIDEIDGLSDKQRLFCYYYMQSLNAFQAAVKAGYSPSYGKTHVYKLLEKASVKNFLYKLKEQQRQEFLLTQERIINRHVQVALSDITDYFNEDGSLKPLSEVDGSLVRKIKITKKDDYESAEIQLIEKCPSLAWLTKFAGLDPDTNIAKQRLEIEKEKVYGTGNGEGKTSGSIEKAKSILIKLRGNNEGDR